MDSPGRLAFGRCRAALLPEAEDNAGRDGLVFRDAAERRRRGRRGVFERGAVGFDVLQQFEAEIVERELGERDARRRGLRGRAPRP